MKNGLLFFLVVVGLCSCSTQEVRRQNYESALGKRVGQDINGVIGQIGPPSKTFQMPNGNVMYTWSNSQRRYVSSTTNPNYFAPRNAKVQPQLNTDTQEVVYGCDTTFVTGQDGKIISWLWKGNSCF